MKIFKIYILLIFAISCTACKKNANESIIAGDTEKFNVINHDIIIIGKYTDPNGFNTERAYIDLDNDGFDDIYITVYKDTNIFAVTEEGKYIHSISLSIPNPHIEIAKILDSDKRYTTYEEPIYDYTNTLPEKTYKTIENCTPSLFSTISHTYSTIKYMNEGDIISSNLDWIGYGKDLNIKNSKTETKFSETKQDTVIIYHEIYEDNCYYMEMNKKYFIPFRKEKKGDYYYGWFEMKVSTDYSISIYNSVIKK